MLSGEIFSPTRLLFQYIKALTKSEKLRAFISPKMTYLITFPHNNGKSAVHTGGDIPGIFRYLEMIGAPTTLTNPGHHFFILALHLPATMMQRLCSQLLQLSEGDRKVFVDAVEELEKNLIHVSSVVQNSSRQVLGER